MTQVDHCASDPCASSTLVICSLHTAPEVPFSDVVTGGPFPPHLAPACPGRATWCLATVLSVLAPPLLPKSSHRRNEEEKGFWDTSLNPNRPPQGFTFQKRSIMVLTLPF